MPQWAWICARLQQLGWRMGHTSEGFLGMCDARRLFLGRCGRVELMDDAASAAGVPLTRDPTWHVTLDALRISERTLRYDPGSDRWI
jgi:hypothetical protein